MAPMSTSDSSEPFLDTDTRQPPPRSASFLKSPTPQRRQAAQPVANGSIVANGTPKTTSRIKCVLIGDGAVGKTSLIVSYTTNGYPSVYVPTAFDNYSAIVTVDNNPIRLQLCDTAGQDDFDSLRPLCYPDTDVFLVCFSVVAPSSFASVCDKWLPEMRRHRDNVPLILVGTQCDLKQDVKVLIDLANNREQPVATEAAEKFAQKVGAYKYIECSALTQKNLKDVFDSAILAGLAKSNQRAQPPASPSASSCASRPNDIISWGKQRSKKFLGNLTKDPAAKEQLDKSVDSTTARISKHQTHSKVFLPAAAGNLITKKPRWKRLVCCL